MSTTLPHGIIQINEGNIAWYGDITANWQLIDGKIGIYDAAIATIPAPANTGTLTINYGGATLAMFGADDAGNVTADIPAAGDGALTIMVDGITAGTFTANQATPETIDIPAPGDGTLTIQLNGVDVQTFTANQSGNATANITVPTKTSDLTNDSGFITSDDTKIPLAGSDQISGDLIPSTDGTVNLGSPSYQWNQAYIKSLTINGVAAGDILTHNASEFVGITGAQTIGGVKTFASNITIQGGKKVICNLDNSFIELDGGTTWGKGGSIVLSGQDRSSYTNSVLIVSKSDTNTDILQYQNGELKPVSNNTNNSSLGTSTNKWKSFNGINPGALSLPGAFVNVDTTDWVLDGSNVNIFTPTSDGWFGIQATDTVYNQMHYVFVGRNDNSSYHSQNVLSPINALWNGEYHGCVFIPVIKNINYDIRCICSNITATFYPCQGNV